jgi:hypothetical protein
VRRGGGPGGEAELPQDVRDVPVHGVLADHQPLGDLAVREPLGEQAQHLPLPRRHLRERILVVACGRGDEEPGPLGLRLCSELGQGIQGSGRLAPGRIGTALGEEAGGELDPRPRGLEGRAASVETVDGVLQQRASASVVAAGGREHALGLVGAGRERRRADEPLDFPQRLEARRRLLELPAGDPGVGEQLEDREAREPSLLRELAQHPLEQLDGPKGLAPVEREASPADLRRPEGADLVEEPGSLVRPPLSPPQLGQTEQGAAGPRRPRARIVLVCGREGGLRLGPSAPPEVHRPVLGPAEREHVAAPVALRELRDAVAPLERPPVVERGRAGGDEHAAGPGARDGDRRLALQRGRGGLVETPHALLHLRARNERGAVEREPEHLQVRHSVTAAELRGEGGEPPGLGAVAVRVRDVALVKGEPAVVGPRLELVQKAMRAAQPAARHCPGAVEVELVGREPGRHAGGGGRVPSPPVEAVRQLPRLEHRLRVVDPPRRPAHALEGLGRLLLR